MSLGLESDEGWEEERLPGGREPLLALKTEERFMLLMVQPELLIRLVKLVTEGAPGFNQIDPTLTLTAGSDRLRVRRDKSAAESEAIVLADGQCTLSCRRLLRALMACKAEENITLKADERYLYIGRRHVPVQSYSATAPGLEEFQVFVASANGLIASRPVAHKPTSGLEVF